MDREELKELFAELTITEQRPWCYHVSPIPNSFGNYMLSTVVKDEPGHFVTDLGLGPDLKVAEMYVRAMNDRMSVTPAQAAMIVTSSMRRGVASC
jgi:hypothetical protein